MVHHLTHGLLLRVVFVSWCPGARARVNIKLFITTIFLQKGLFNLSPLGHRFIETCVL